MPAHARVWVYKSASAFTAEQQQRILEAGRAFIAGWAAHGARLDAAVDVLFGHFVVVAVDEEQALASGCSIDKSVRFIQDLERMLGAPLTDRMVVLYDGPQGLMATRVPEVEALLRAGTIHAGTLVYDDLVGTKADLDARFRVPIKDTWMARWL